MSFALIWQARKKNYKFAIKVFGGVIQYGT